MREEEGMHSQGSDKQLPFIVVRDHIGGIVARWKNAPAAVNVVAEQSDLPGYIQDYIISGQTVKGAFDLQANTVHLVSANLKSLDEAEAALIHEAIGHFGVEAFLGERAGRYYADVARLFGRRGLRDIAKDYRLDLNNPNDLLVAAKEKVAHLATSLDSEFGILGRLIGETRDALRRIGFTLRLNETDIKTMIGRAKKLVKNGKHSVSLNGNPIHPLNGISAFRKWFKKSKVVTKDGNPLVVYRGTQFAHTKNPESLGKTTQRFAVSDAIFTTDNPRMASSYAAKPDYAYEYMPEDMAREAREEVDSMSPGVFPLYCSLQNPLEVDRCDGPLGNMQELVNRAKAGGHDGLIIKNIKDSAPDGPMEFFGERGTLYVVFSREQVKSAFDPGFFPSRNPYINFLIERENDPQSNSQFRQWFGSSKVTDGDGKPLVVYHGTSSDFTKFEKGNGKFYKDTKGAIFFTTNAKVAESYLPSQFYTDDGETVKKWYAPGSSLMPVYLSVRNPMVVDYFGGGYREGELRGYIQDAKKSGHDGIFFLNIADVGIGSTGRPKVAHTIVVFNPKQIKSLYNSGQFSTKTADIRFLYGGQNAKGYSQAPAKFCSLYDHKERFEIDDSLATLRPLKTHQDGTVDAYMMLGDVLDHPELYRHYPVLKSLDVHIEIAPNLVATGKFTAFEDRSAKGLFDIQPEISVKAADVKSAMEIFIHEVQHYLQGEEGFAIGGNPDQFRITTMERASWQADQRYWYAIRAVKTTAKDENLSIEEAAEILKREGDYEISATVVDNARVHTFASIQRKLELIDQALKKSYGFASYLAMAGEIEARDAAARTDLDAAGRRAVAPYSGENIPPKEAIVQYDQGQTEKHSREVNRRRDRRRSACGP